MTTNLRRSANDALRTHLLNRGADLFRTMKRANDEFGMLLMVTASGFQTAKLNQTARHRFGRKV